MKKIAALFSALLLLASLSACSASWPSKGDLAEMSSGTMGGLRIVHWEDRTYVPFCVVSKNDRGDPVGYVDGDTDDRISAYKDYSTKEWLVNWMSTDGGAFLLKEEHVTEIPEGLTQEYTVDDNR